MMHDVKILSAKILKLHGIRGNVVIESYIENIESFINKIFINDDIKENIIFNIVGKLNGGKYIFSIEGISSADEARNWIGEELYILRNDLPKLDKGYYVCDLLGFDAIDDRSQNKIGIIKDIVDFGSGFNLEVKTLQEKLEYYVYDNTVVVDLDIKQVKIKLPEYV